VKGRETARQSSGGADEAPDFEPAEASGFLGDAIYEHSRERPGNGVDPGEGRTKQSELERQEVEIAFNWRKDGIDSRRSA
jgi:hypothetical protein